MSRPLARPRLGEHVLARRHIVDGEERVVLHDTRTGRLLQIGSREWGLIAVADGTRDLEGILLAGAREGAHARLPVLQAFFEQLAQAGLLEEGILEEPPETELDEDTRKRPLEQLPDFSLHCDGQGSCCRIYASVVFSPLEAARARALMPRVLGGGERHERAFLPEKGSAPSAASAIGQINGRCAYLDDDGRCALHAAGGAHAKPHGCNLFPARFVDDGDTVRVSVSVECACVIASIGRPGGAPLIAPVMRTRGDLPETAFVEELPSSLPLTDTSVATRAELLAWSRRLAALTPPGDLVSALFNLGEALAVRDPDDALASFERPSSLSPDALRPYLEALHQRALRRVREDAAWRSERDLARLATSWIALAAERLLEDPSDLASRARPELEAFYLRAILFGHQLFGELPLARALCDRAIRLLLARALPEIIARSESADPAAREPLALVEAMLRGHGLDAYAFDL